MELIAGCRDARQLSEVRELLRRFHVLPVGERISLRARDLMETFTLGHGLLLPDALIAATALEADVPLYTKNARHFQMVPDLQVIRPY